MSACKWCGRRPAIPEDYNKAEAGGSEDHVCWREWNDYSDCHEIERGLIDLAPLMRDVLVAEENLRSGDEWIYATRLRAEAIKTLKLIYEDFPGGGVAVEKPRITPLPAAAGIPGDDDLDDVPLGKACSLDGDSCESCQ